MIETALSIEEYGGSGRRNGQRALYRLAEENDKFCGACVRQWENRVYYSQIPDCEGEWCHVCGRIYEGYDILGAMPITRKSSGECSICCRECFDAIKEMSKELVR